MPLVVHFNRPSGWRAPVNIHFWDTAPAVPATTWPGVAMTAEASDWFVYQFATAEAASIVFNDGAGRQTRNLRRDRLGWFYTNNNWYDANPERPEIPVMRANPRARTYTTPQAVTLESSNDYDVIYYTTDGSNPTPPSPDGTFANASTVRYTGPVTVSQSLTIRALGVNSDGEVGQLRTFTYTIDPNADLEEPTIAAGQPYGTYQTPIDVVFTIRDNRPVPVTAYYTLDGSAPSSASQVYVQANASAGLAGPAIAVSAATIRFLVVDGANNETRQSFYYNIGPVSPPIDFREETMYFLITSRFNDGDSNNNFFCRDRIKFNSTTHQAEDPHWRGDFKGLIQRLDYIRDLGFTAIWITPPVENRSGLDYHGYHPYDWMRIDPRLESPYATYEDLINQAHSRGSRIIPDLVINHSSQYGIRDQEWIDHLPIKYYVPQGSQQGRVNNGPYQRNLGIYTRPSSREDNDNSLAPDWFRSRQTSDPEGVVPLTDPRAGQAVPSPGYNPQRFFGVDANTLDTDWYHQEGYIAGGDWESQIRCRTGASRATASTLFTEHPTFGTTSSTPSTAISTCVSMGCASTPSSIWSAAISSSTSTPGRLTSQDCSSSARTS